jgi:hypothetical protein
MVGFLFFIIYFENQGFGSDCGLVKSHVFGLVVEILIYVNHPAVIIIYLKF